MIKTFESHANYEPDMVNYLRQAAEGDYEDITANLFLMISEEGFVEELEVMHEASYDIDDFEYITLNITNEDKQGLINGDDNTSNKFNDFDIKLKDTQLPDYPTCVDFIEYGKGIVRIIRLI